MRDQAENTGLNRHAFEQLFRKHYRELVNFGISFLNDQNTSEEIVQEVFLNLWKKSAEMSTDRNIKSYLYTSVKNRCLNYIRDHKKFRSYVLDVEIELTSEETDHLRQEEIRNEIERALAKLPEKCRQVFEYSRFDELKYREIAEKMDISVKTVEAQMSKALRILAKELKDLIYLFLIILKLL